MPLSVTYQHWPLIDETGLQSDYFAIKIAGRRPADIIGYFVATKILWRCPKAGALPRGY